MTGRSRSQWLAVVVLASVFTLFNIVELGAGVGGWPQVVGLPLGVGAIVYCVARLRGWDGLQR